MVVVKGCGEERVGSYCLMGIRIQFGKMKAALEMDGSDGSQHYQYNILNATELYA